jgi:hypothetical protein
MGKVGGLPLNRLLSHSPDKAINSSNKCPVLVGQMDVCFEGSGHYFKNKGVLDILLP